MGLFFDKDAGRRAPKTSLRLNDLAQSMETGPRPAALVVFRDCFMNTLEAAYQFRGVSEFMIASQSLVPVSGIWPWASLMSSLMPSASSADQALAFAKGLGRFLDDEPNRAPFHDAPSLLDLGAADAIVRAAQEPGRCAQEARRDASSQAMRTGARKRARGECEIAPPWRSVTARRADDANGCRHGHRCRRAAARRLGDVPCLCGGTMRNNRRTGAPASVKPVTRKGKVPPASTMRFREDAANYRQLALSAATGWDHSRSIRWCNSLVALFPLHHHAN
jgi:hypothetical protein